MIITKDLLPNFIGVQFENDYNCVVYIDNNKTYFVVTDNNFDLDHAIALHQETTSPS